MQNKFVFGITGGSGSGKTTESNLFRAFGAEVIDCDVLSREITVPGSSCLSEIVNEFGLAILMPDGSLNRRSLGKIVFENKDKLKILSKITHKYIYERVCLMIKSSSNDIIGIDGAVIIGSEVESLCECMVCVIANDEIRKKRIMQRDNISEQTAEERLYSQKSNNFYIENSDYIVYNDTDEKELQIHAKEVFEKLTERKEERKR